jgi:hypothetical protein
VFNDPGIFERTNRAYRALLAMASRDADCSTPAALSSLAFQFDAATGALGPLLREERKASSVERAQTPAAQKNPAPQPTALESPELRDLSPQDAMGLGAGANHYRAYVGPPDRFDFVGASHCLLRIFGRVVTLASSFIVCSSMTSSSTRL